MNYTFRKVEFEQFEEASTGKFPHKALFTTKDWFSFLIRYAHIKPIIVEISGGGNVLGYFYAGEIKKFGIKILASPFGGWGTCWMGFDLADGCNKFEIVGPLWDFLSKRLHYYYAEITDRDFSLEEAEKYGYSCVTASTLELRIDRTDEELFKVFKTDCRNFIRQFERRGATIEIAEPDHKFVSEYYDQMIDVFAKQGLTPPNGPDKYDDLFATLGDTGKLLCLRVRSPEGDSIASSIFLGFNEKCYYWAGSSYREHQHYRPNEYMIWTAIKYWRDRGCKIMDMVGDRDYKHKFGPEPVNYAGIYLTKYPLLIQLCNWAKKLYWTMLRIKKVSQR